MIESDASWRLFDTIKSIASSNGQSANAMATCVRVLSDGTRMMQLVGSSILTPLNGSMAAEIGQGDMAEVRIEDGVMSLTANVSNPSVGQSEVNDAVADKATVRQLGESNARIEHLEVTALTAESATIANLQADTAKVHNLTADQLTAATAYVGALDAGNVTAAQLIADHATVGALDSTYAKVDMANVNNAWINNGTIKDGAIVSAMINDVSANKLTAGTINGSVINVTNLNADNITAGTINGQRIGQGSLSLDKLSEDVYTESEVDSKLDTMQAEIDGAIETWTGTVVPTLNNSPASGWTTSAVRDTHVGDVYFVVNSQSQQNGYNYRFTKSGSTYSWQLIKDNDVTNALQRLETAEGKITSIESFDSTVSSFMTNTDDELSSVKSRATSLETRMTDAEGDISDKVDTSTFNSLSQTVDTNTASITSLSNTVSQKADGSTVTALTNRVSTVEQDVDGIETSIGELQTTVSEKADSSTVTTVSNRLNTVSDTVDGHTQSITSLQSTVSQKADSSTVSTLQSDYATFKQQTEQFESTVGTTYATKTELKDATDDITELESRVSTNETSISNNSSAIELKANSSDVYTKTAVDGKITQEVSDRNAAITAKANEITSSVSETYATKTAVNGKADASDVTALAGRVTTAESNITQNAQNIELKVSKDGVISSINQSAESVKIQASRVEIDGTAVFNAIKSSTDAAYDAKGAAATVQSNLDNLEIGGRNLLLLSSPSSENLAKTLNSNASYTTLVTEDGYQCYKVWGGSTYGNFYASKLKIYLDADTTYTYSAWVKVTTTASGVTSVSHNFTSLGHFSVVNANSSASDKSHEDIASKRVYIPSTVTIGVWTRLVMQFTTNSLSGSTFGKYLKHALGDEYTVFVREMKLEKGNKATDWSPAPEDLQSSAVSRTQRIYYRWNSATAPAAPSTWVTKGDDGSALWTKMHVAITSTHKYIYTCEQYEMADGTLGHTDVLLDNTITVIDGGNIITGSVTANKLNASDINASKSLTVGAMTDAAAATILNSSVQVGGRNLYKSTTSTNLFGNGSVTAYDPSYHGFTLTPANANQTLRIKNVIDQTNVPYTISFTCTASVATNVAIDVMDNTIQRFDVVSGTSRIVCTSTPLAAVDDVYNFVDLAFGASGTFKLSDIKIERGNKPTDWSPAPEDVDAAVSDAAKTATNYIVADSSGIKIADTNPASSTTYQHQTSSGTDFVVNGGVRNRVNADGMTLYDGSGVADSNIFAKFASQLIELGRNSINSIIKLCNGVGKISVKTGATTTMRIETESTSEIGAHTYISKSALDLAQAYGATIGGFIFKDSISTANRFSYATVTARDTGQVEIDTQRDDGSTQHLQFDDSGLAINSTKGIRGINFGFSSATTNSSGVTTFNPNLGTKPTAVFVAAGKASNETEAVAKIAVPMVWSIDSATQVQVRWQRSDTNAWLTNNAVGWYWLALA